MQTDRSGVGAQVSCLRAGLLSQPRVSNRSDSSLRTVRGLACLCRVLPASESRDSSEATGASGSSEEEWEVVLRSRGHGREGVPPSFPRGGGFSPRWGARLCGGNRPATVSASDSQANGDARFSRKPSVILLYGSPNLIGSNSV